jgi:hypothetical protein
MPWCPTCDRYLAPSTVRTDGNCPTCGRPVDKAELAADETEREALPPIPWHFKLLVVAVAIYLSYRLYQGIMWLVH